MARVIRMGIDKLIKILSSYGLTCILLLCLFGLTFWGTLAQIDLGLHEAQKKFFDSWYWRLPQIGPFAFPMPGGMLVMTLLFVNLIFGGLLRMRRSMRIVGIYIFHTGIAFLLIAGFVKSTYAVEGSIQLYEKESASEFQSYQDWEIAINELLAEGQVKERIISSQEVKALRPRSGTTFTNDELPFDVILNGYLRNCRPMPGTATSTIPAVGGFFLDPRELETEPSANFPGVYVTLKAKGVHGGPARQELLWGRQLRPLTLNVGPRSFELHLRRERFPLPFKVTLVDFRKEDHPGTRMAKSFESDILVEQDGIEQKSKIWMNNPLRKGGFTFYQSSWGPSNAMPGTALYSVFAVSTNPADQWPWYACIVIAIGLLIHFILKLVHFIETQLTKIHAQKEVLPVPRSQA